MFMHVGSKSDDKYETNFYMGCFWPLTNANIKMTQKVFKE